MVLLGSVACSSAQTEVSEDASLESGRLPTSHRATDATSLAGAAHTDAITYMSQNAAGRPIVVSGSVAFPRSPAPDGGYPVISWAHGTTGVADACAPSADFPDGPSHEYLAGVDNTLEKWVDRGFVVVRTDYEGLGTPDIHPYVNGISEMNTVVDIVRAAREMDDTVGTRWYAVGHSQGGQAALFTAAHGAQRAPELSLTGAVAIAPGSGLDRTPDYFRSEVSGIEAAEAFLPLLLLGAQAADASIDASALLTDEAQPLLGAARTGCLNDIRQVPPIPAGQVFRKDADLAPLKLYLTEQEPSHLDLAVPTLVTQSNADVVVAKSSTDSMVETLRQNGNQFDYQTYDGFDHRATVAASEPDIERFFEETSAK